MYKVVINGTPVSFDNYGLAFLYFSDAIGEARSEGFVLQDFSRQGENLTFLGINNDHETFFVQLIGLD